MVKVNLLLCPTRAIHKLAKIPTAISIKIGFVPYYVIIGIIVIVSSHRCSRTDIYIYTSSACTGRISKLGLFIGSGVTIGILFIVSIILGIYIYLIKRPPSISSLYDGLYVTTII